MANRLTNEPAVILEICSGSIDRVAADIKIESSISDGVGRDSNGTGVDVARAEIVSIGRCRQRQINASAEFQFPLPRLRQVGIWVRSLGQ